MEISFESSTFFVQIHDLSPAYLHEEMTKLLGSKIEKIHHNTINKKCVVSHRFLRFIVEMEINCPIPTSFFWEMTSGNDLWIQFKLKRLLDFCFKCGFLDHVTRWCSFNISATVTSPNGISAQLYGPWIRAENNGFISFINMPEVESTRWSEDKNTTGEKELAQLMMSDRSEKEERLIFRGCEDRDRDSNMRK